MVSTRFRRGATALAVALALAAADGTSIAVAQAAHTQAAAKESSAAGAAARAAASWGSGWAGHVLSARPLPKELWLPHTARAYRVLYLSTSADGGPRIVSGAVFVPDTQAPKGGHPVVGWAHGTVGVADDCAPSRNPRSARDAEYLGAWLGAGYAVVATDYEGLGTPGPHPYLVGKSEAHSVIDMVRAARRVVPSLSRKWLTVGQSQGGQASLFTGDGAERYAPELDFRGTVATAPPSQWKLTVSVLPNKPEDPANPLLPMILAGVASTHPQGFDPADYLTPLGLRYYRDAKRSSCLDAVTAKMAADHVTVGQFQTLDETRTAKLVELLEGVGEVPIAKYGAPVYIAQGTADRTVYPPATALTAKQLAAAGTDVTFKFYVGADHGGVMKAALPDLLAWAAKRFEG
ncbi:lipase family protein [Wenjunlia tyrosinilytica]|uniref:Lipase n=1 Tax=Wenjunlia tyrosinilytica TaxID=1544741 RepID=A0A917ZEF3_9ACTN|nr:lipase family protein [Wenjunlia tyrosinilytica]GGO80404.1 lipase [Wenjunlia tyrosinilytica]